jgi:excisionase family DNA binding protein
MSIAESQRTLLTIEQVAHRLQVSRSTVRRRIGAGEIPAVQLGGKRAAIRIPEDELDRWLYHDEGER